MKNEGIILYYAMGGGLGHITRTFAVLREIKSFPCPVRILASGGLAGLALPDSPAPVDIVPGEILNSWEGYSRFLEIYIESRNVRAIILDTFPYGIAGEWRKNALNLPRILIARSLKWGAYLGRIIRPDGPAPISALAIEELEPGYLDFLNSGSKVSFLEEPIIYSPDGGTINDSGVDGPDNWLVVHSGGIEEQKSLIGFAMDKMRDCGCRGELHKIFPGHGVFPAQKNFHRYSCIVSAAGYNMAALASRSMEGRRHYLMPFNRRYDDQHGRIKRAGLWKGKGGGGASIAARWVEESIKKIIDI